MVVFEHLRIISFEQFVDEAHTLRDHRVLPSRLGRTQPRTSAGSALCPRQPSGFPFPSFSHWREIVQRCIKTGKKQKARSKGANLKVR